VRNLQAETPSQQTLQTENGQKWHESGRWLGLGKEHPETFRDGPGVRRSGWSGHQPPGSVEPDPTLGAEVVRAARPLPARYSSLKPPAAGQSGEEVKANGTAAIEIT
jgi:hypothetical protein